MFSLPKKECHFSLGLALKRTLSIWFYCWLLEPMSKSLLLSYQRLLSPLISAEAPAGYPSKNYSVPCPARFLFLSPREPPCNTKRPLRMCIRRFRGKKWRGGGVLKSPSLNFNPEGGGGGGQRHRPMSVFSLNFRDHYWPVRPKICADGGGASLRVHEGFYFRASCQPIDRKVFF